MKRLKPRQKLRLTHRARRMRRKKMLAILQRQAFPPRRTPRPETAKALGNLTMMAGAMMALGPAPLTLTDER